MLAIFKRLTPVVAPEDFGDAYRRKSFSSCIELLTRTVLVEQLYCERLLHGNRSDADKITSVGSEVLTAVVMKNTVLGDIRPCSPLEVN
jgi:hypothetical protein